MGVRQGIASGGALARGMVLAMADPMILPRDPPRDLKALGLEDALGFMIRVKVFVAWLLIVGGGLMTPIAALVLVSALRGDGKMPLSGAVVLASTALGELAIGLWWRRRLKRAKERRRHALERGRPVVGKVDAVWPAPGLSLAMGRLDRCFVVTYEAPDGAARKTRFVSPLGIASSWLRPGASIEGLVVPETNDVLFPAELGLDVKFQ